MIQIRDIISPPGAEPSCIARRRHGRPGMLAALAFGAGLLAACQSHPQPQMLGRNMLACRQASLTEEIQRGGPRFQRLADDAMASGACRLFQRGQQVAGLETRGALVTFVDPASGRSYWAAR